MCFPLWFPATAWEKAGTDKITSWGADLGVPTKLGPGSLALMLRLPEYSVPMDFSSPSGPTHSHSDLLHPHVATKLLSPCFAPHHFLVFRVSGFSCHPSVCVQSLHQGPSTHLQYSHRLALASFAGLAQLISVLPTGLVTFGRTLLAWLSATHPPRIILGTERQVTWKFSSSGLRMLHW